MRSSTGRWVTGNDFFGRDAELAVLNTRVRERNHVLLTGQRRMGKTSLARELGRRLQADGWNFLFVDVEEAQRAEDVVALVAQQAHGLVGRSSRLRDAVRRWVDNVEEIGAFDLRLKLRADLNAANWRRRGEELLEACVEPSQPLLVVLDELPIFLLRVLGDGAGRAEVDAFLSWQRGVAQALGDRPFTLLVSGSIGLVPLVSRLGLPDRVNHFSNFRLGPWDRDTCCACLRRLSETHGVGMEPAVPQAVYARLGVGIPHHVQSFFAHLREDALIGGRGEILLEAVDRVYRESLLGPWGQNDLFHYETRLREALDDQAFRVALEVLTEAAAVGAFTVHAAKRLQERLAALDGDSPDSIAHVVTVLVHDGYLTENDDRSYSFPSRLLGDWWAARFGSDHRPLDPKAGTTRGGQ
ncbi:MAG: ATP-binding protein [Boseongicola sp. SB0662_bin_57]|nr:ATP-binding protein [Boseongicola sp. SB0662_bin_57]